MFSQKLSDFIENYHQKTGFSGVIRITKADEIIHSQSFGYADKENKIPFTNDSMFTFYSLSKPFCAIAMMRLFDLGKVDILAHPSKYIPECSVLDKNLNLVHVMRHNSGIPDYFMEENFSHLRGTPEDVKQNLSELFKHDMYFPAGENAKYANINYNLMAIIIEKVSDMPYAEFMKKEVFAPLGANTLLVDSEGLNVPSRVQGYAKTEDGEIYRADRDAFCMLGAGDLIGRVDDVYTLNLAVKHKRLLTENSWNMVLTPSPYNHMGFGCTVKNYDGKIRITHNGGHTGFRTYHIHILTDDFDVIMLTNSGWGLGRTDIETEIYKLWYGHDITKGVLTPMDTGYI